MDKKAFIDKLFEQSSNFQNEKQARGFASMLNTISSDIYSESQRFVFELIQNADDSAEGEENEVHFEFLPKALIVYHNGKVFSEQDINSITDAGASTKIEDPTKTGYKGIGFKSVFGKSDRVSIFSNGYQLRFDKHFHQKILPWQVIPIWSELSDYNSSIRKSLKTHSYNVATVIELSSLNDLQQELNEIIEDGQVLLFLRFISGITVSRNGLIDYSISKQTEKTEESYTRVKLFKENSLSSEWLVKNYPNIVIPEFTRQSLEQDIKTPDKLKKSEFTEIAFAAQLIEDKIRPIETGKSLIYTYLPTKANDFNFPFLVNGSFMTTTAREALFEDRVWNQWLFSVIGEKIMFWLSDLSKTNYNFQVLNILPEAFAQDQNRLKRSFDSSFTLSSIEHKFITTSSGGIKNAGEVLLDETGLSLQSFLDKASITRFLLEEQGLLLPDDCFVHEEMEMTLSLKLIGVETFDADNIGLYFRSKAFTDTHQVTSNFSLIKYFKQLSDADTSGEWFQTLKELPFVFDENLILRNPGNGICFPTKLNTTDLGEIPIIHSEVYRQIRRDNEIYSWLRELGISEPSDITYVTNIIIPGLADPNYITEENFYAVTFYLFRLFNKGDLNEEMLESLRELKLKTIGPPSGFEEAQNCFLSSPYRPKLPIQYSITSISYVSSDYLLNGDELAWIRFFKAIKVKEDITIETINSNNDLKTLNELTDPQWVSSSRSIAESRRGFGFGLHNRIDNLKIPSFLNLTSENYDYAVIFWENLLESPESLASLQEKAHYRYGTGNGHNNLTTWVDNYFSWYVANKNCIPTSTNALMSPKDVFLNTDDIKKMADKFLPVFNFKGTLSVAWKLFFNFKDKLEMEDYLTILSRIWEDAKADDPIEKVSVSRIGMIYNQLAQIVEGLADFDKRMISEWASKNKILSGTGDFEWPEELKWIMIDGFSEESTNLKMIRLPSNTKLDADGFKELMRLWGVQIINEFIPSFEHSTQEFTLPRKLQQVLPILAAVAAKKSGNDGTELFDKLYHCTNETSFFSASEIKLYFEFEGEQYDGPILNVYRTNNIIYFKGGWRKERTLLNLIKELIALMKLTGFDGELRFLLMEEEDNEIQGWLNDQHVDPSSILPVKIFRKKTTLLPQQQERHKARSKTYKKQIDFKFAIPLEDIDFHKVNQRNETLLKQSQPRKNYGKVENEEYRNAVGRWCEGYINSILIASREFSEILWLNKDRESGAPYDFVVKQSGVEKYLEVKGTSSLEKNLIYLSREEWNAMYDNRDNYVLLRVYGAGTIKSRYEWLENPFDKIQSGQISVVLEL